MTINSLQQLFFIAVTFLLILCSSGLKKLVFSQHTGCGFYKVYMSYIFSLAVWKACLPWDVFKKTIMLRAVHNLQT